MNPEELKLVVREKYGQIARQSLIQQEVSRCGGSSCCGEHEISMIGDEYSGIDGNLPDADLGLGCGLPIQYAGISDVVTKGILPENLKKDAEMYAGCVAGAIDMMDYQQFITQEGFVNVIIKKQKVIEIPDRVLNALLTSEESADYMNGRNGIFSMTISGYKPN